MIETCSKEGCSKPASVKGLCVNHYRYHGREVRKESADFSSIAASETRLCTSCKKEKAISEFGRMINARSAFNPLGLHIYCKECTRSKARDYYHDNKDDSMFIERRRENRLRWVENNPERNKEFYTYYRQLQRLAESAEGADRGITAESLHERDSGICQICFEECTIEDSSVDHILPISRGGLHIWTNVQLAHLSCNCSKGARYGWIADTGDGVDASSSETPIVLNSETMFGQEVIRDSEHNLNQGEDNA